MTIIAVIETCTNIGLFGVIRGTVRNLGLENTNIAIESAIPDGDFVTVNAGSISGVAATSGSGASTIQNVYNTGNISVSSNAFLTVGGIVGRKGYATITDVYNTANITSDGASAGGIAGSVGRADGVLGTVSNSFNTGNITSHGNVGGIIGCIGSGMSIERSFNSGNITAVGDGSIAGGILGEADPRDGLVIVRDCYNSGDVTGNATGGIAGFGGLIITGYTNCELPEFDIALAILRYVIGLSTEIPICVTTHDFNDDGVVDIADALIVLRWIIGLGGGSPTSCGSTCATSGSPSITLTMLAGSRM
jgi:hypothetical protein